MGAKHLSHPRGCESQAPPRTTGRSTLAWNWSGISTSAGLTRCFGAGCFHASGVISNCHTQLNIPCFSHPRGSLDCSTLRRAGARVVWLGPRISRGLRWRVGLPDPAHGCGFRVPRAVAPLWKAAGAVRTRTAAVKKLFVGASKQWIDSGLCWANFGLAQVRVTHH